MRLIIFDKCNPTDSGRCFSFWPHSTGWGYSGPSGGLGLILVILLICVLLGVL